jgi:PE family
MAAELHVDPQQIRESAAGLQNTAAELETHAASFRAEVQSMVQPPGNDPISPLIWAAHGAVFGAALRCLATNTAALRSHAAKLDKTAANYRSAEQANVTAADRIRAELG